MKTSRKLIRGASAIAAACTLLCFPPTSFAQSAPIADARPSTPEITPQAILGAMEGVADWQLAHPGSHRSTDWTQAVGYNGMMALAGISGKPAYRDAMVRMGEANGWQLGERPYHADDHAVAQTYAELYLQLREPKMIQALRARFDDILAHPRTGTLDFTAAGNQERWSWCDALYMAPPAWLRLWTVSGDQRYLDFAVREWWATSDYLYDKDEHLYYRDSNAFGKHEANGAKVFWGRGNGWVMGGLVRMLEFLPTGHPERARFERQYREMAARVVKLQQADGLWRSSLLDPASYPMKESSGSALFTYALAWGVNQGLLDRPGYEAAVRKAWAALAANVNPDGRLTHVQPIGLAPRLFDEQATEVYGVGAFLLAGSEMYRLAVMEHTKARTIAVKNSGGLLRSDELAEAPLPAAMRDPVVMDAATSTVLPSQVAGDRLLFPVNLTAGATRRYLVLPADALAARPPVLPRTHARFVPERLDDFAWESDRIAHRTYGPAIIKDPRERLVSSGMDVWVKSTRAPVVDKWYKSGDYHTDKGEGLDYYSVGRTRGCGGTAIVASGRHYDSSNFAGWKVLADGPLRAIFELRYERWDAAGRAVSEVKRMSIDAGSNFTRVESRFSAGGKGALDVGVGIVGRPGDGQQTSDAADGWMSYWEPSHGKDGSTACAAILPGGVASFASMDGQYFAIGKATPGRPFVYWFGAGWSKSGDFADAAAWEAHVSHVARRIRAPLEVDLE
jgi:unsaturated rhamnogalacturonyl hydrolase